MQEVIESVRRAIIATKTIQTGALFGSDIDAIARAAIIATLKGIREPSEATLAEFVRYPAELVAERNSSAYTRAMQAATLADRATAANHFATLIDAALKEIENV